MKQKQIYLLLALATAAMLATFAYRVRHEGSDGAEAQNAPFTRESKEAPAMAKPAPSPEDFSEKAQGKIEQCLGGKAGNFAELEALAEKSTGTLKQDTLEWKIVQFEDESGAVFRARLEKEAGGIKLSLFSVDEEGLPDRILTEAGATLDSILRGKRVAKEIESHTLDYESGYRVTLEREDGQTQKFAVAGGSVRLACETTADGPDCHCVR